MGISRGGDSAEERYRKATGASKAAKSGDGDAVLGGSLIEIKKASAMTLNQVRAVKYLPLVALHEPTDTWYVVPAHVVVYLVSSKARGQHTENPFESATLSVRALERYRVASESALKRATLDAIAESRKYPELARAMENILAESKALASRSLREVRGLVSTLGLEP